MHRCNSRLLYPCTPLQPWSDSLVPLLVVDEGGADEDDDDEQNNDEHDQDCNKKHENTAVKSVHWGV